MSYADSWLSDSGKEEMASQLVKEKVLRKAYQRGDIWECEHCGQDVFLGDFSGKIETDNGHVYFSAVAVSPNDLNEDGEYEVNSGFYLMPQYLHVETWAADCDFEAQPVAEPVEPRSDRIDRA